MERLTKESESGMVWFVDHENDEMILEPCEMNAHHSRLAIQKLATYENLEEQGKLLTFPIDENTPVYSIEYCCGEQTDYTIGVCFMGFCKDCDKKSYYIKNGIAKQCSLSELGKSVFFTQEQADEALEKMKNSHK